MLRITRGEDSKLTSWFFEIDRSLLVMIFVAMAVGIITMISAGSADASRLGYPWYHFLQKAFIPYTIGLFCLIGFSMMNKKQIIRISFIGLVICLGALLLTAFDNPLRIIKNNSHRWIRFAGQTVMPSDILKPFFIVVTAWFLSKMRKVHGSDIFLNKEAWKIKNLSWWPYLIIFFVCILLIVLHPDLGTTILYFGVFAVMLFVACLPLKWLGVLLGGGGGLGAIAIALLPQLAHVRTRISQMFYVEPRSQAWFSLNAIKHGGLFGSGDESFVKDNLPESTNDFVYSSFAEDWGAIGACALLVLLFFILTKLIKHAASARDDFVVFTVTGAAVLFGGQICFNLMTALHLFVNKGMTLPFVSYGGVSFITFCILFGIVLALVREDTWNR